MKNRYEIHGDVVYIFINRQDESEIKVLIDTDDLTLANSFPNSFVLRSGYASGYLPKKGKCRKVVFLHRLVMKAPDGMEVTCE